MSLRDIKTKIKSVDRTRKVTKAMETVSAAKMRKTQQRALSGRSYARAALSIVERLQPSLTTAMHPLTVVRPVSRVAFIVVTSDKGLCGVLNAAVLKTAERTIAQYSELTPQDFAVFAFGKKAVEYFERRGYHIAQRYENISDEIQLDALSGVAEAVTLSFVSGEVDRVEVVFTNFYSTFEQQAVSRTVLPFQKDALRLVVDGIQPTKGALDAPEPARPVPYYTVEPSPDEVLRALLPKLISVLVYHMLLESKASEHSARMVAMKNASDKSRDLSKALTRVYNKSRQAVITREVSEIVGGIEAMAV